MPPEMLAKLSVRLLFRDFTFLIGRVVISPNLLLPSLLLSAILMDLRLPEGYLKLVQDSLLRSDGKGATVQHSRLTPASRLLQ
jgi:hypothetical protein